MGIAKEANKQKIKLEVSLNLQTGLSEEQRKETFLDLCLIRCDSSIMRSQKNNLSISSMISL